MDRVDRIKKFMEDTSGLDGYNVVELAEEAKYEFNIAGSNIPVELLQLARKILLNRRIKTNGKNNQP